MKTPPGVLLGIGCWLAGWGLAAIAAGTDPVLSPRDPMQAPPATAVPAAAASAPGGNADESPNYIVVTGSTRHVVNRGRRLSVGDLLGSSRIARIDDDAVWLRDAQGLRRVPLYPGVVRRPVPQTLTTPTPPASAPTQAPNRLTAKDLPP